MIPENTRKEANPSADREWRWVWGLFAVAVIARCVMALGLNVWLAGQEGRTYLIAGDADGYWQLAQSLVAGEDFSLYTPPRYVMRMPGFPAVLAGSVALFGDSQQAARFVLALLTSLAVFPAVWLARRMHSVQAGRWAGAIIALMPLYVGFSVTILTECLFATVILWNVWAACHWIQCSQPETAWAKTLGWAAATGLLAGAAIYLRPSWLLYPLCLLPSLLLYRPLSIGRAVVGFLVLSTVMVGTLLPWGMRNQQVTGHFVLTTLWMGPSLYDGLHPAATGDSDMTFFEEDRVLDRMSEFEMNQHYKKLALDFAKENPGRAIELALIKFWRFWKPWPNAEQFSNPILGLIVAVGFVFLVVTAGYGVWVERRAFWFVFLCTLPIVYFTGIHLWFVSSLRYRLPAEYPLAVLSGIGLAAWFGPRTSSRETGDAS